MNTLQTSPRSFSQAVGRWVGTAEVYDGNGRFLGNATDRRHVQQEAGSGRVRIDLSFVGPFKFAGHYHIADHGDYRLYEGPANTGFAETLADNLIDANAYWPVTGLTQRFFLMIMPGGRRQMSLALMSRGEKLLYSVVGEYARAEPSEGEEEPGSEPMPSLVNGTSYDLAEDPAAGRGALWLQRSGVWLGELATLDQDLQAGAPTMYREEIRVVDGLLEVDVSGSAFASEPERMRLATNGWEAWSLPGDNDGRLSGSYSLSGGRAMSGQFHFLRDERRLWRREVAAHDGRQKALLHTWYRGGVRIGVQFGVLQFEPA